MQLIGMVGYMDKYDFVINLAKTINTMDKAVLVVDATLDQKLKYIIPALEGMGRAYVTQYNDIDFALGFDSMHDIENYMIDQKINISLYDYIIIDIDSPKAYEFFRTRGIEKTYFFVDTNVLSIAKNKEIVKYMYIDSRIIDFSKFETNDGYRPYQGFIIKLDDDQNIYIDKMEE